MSMADQFWQYAREALLSACEAKTTEDRKGLLELAQTWTQAALVERHSLNSPSRIVASISFQSSLTGSLDAEGAILNWLPLISRKQPIPKLPTAADARLIIQNLRLGRGRVVEDECSPQSCL